jgi:transposase InsO family protein
MIETITHEFNECRRVYGSHRVYIQLKKKGVAVCENTVAKLMSHAGIRSIRVKKFKVKTTDSKHEMPVADNILEREFSVEKPNSVWVGDITYISTLEGTLYLAGVIDLFSRCVVGYSMAEHMRAELVCSAMEMALAQRNHPEGILFHSDRGSQYASNEFRALLKVNQATASMSNVGDCYDNAVIESFWHSLKVELVHRRSFTTRIEAEQAIFEYIEVFSNRVRLHSSIGYVSPAAFEAAHHQAAA